MRNFVVFFAEWSEIMRVMPPTEGKGLRVVQVVSRLFTGGNGAFGTMLFLNDALSSHRYIARFGFLQIFSDGIFLFFDFFFMAI